MQSGLSMFPSFRNFNRSLVSDYGSAWHMQNLEFSTFPGAILMTTNCIIERRKNYKVIFKLKQILKLKNRVFTRELWDGLESNISKIMTCPNLSKLRSNNLDLKPTKLLDSQPPVSVEMQSCLSPTKSSMQSKLEKLNTSSLLVDVMALKAKVAISAIWRLMLLKIHWLSLYLGSNKRLLLYY
jgi:hypothetical protein